jgi:ribosomal protein L32
MQEFNTTQPNRLNRAYANVKAIFIQGELQLPDEEMEFVMKCPFCHTDTLTITSNADLEIARTPGKEFERKILYCKSCNNKVTVGHQVQAALQQGYKRLNQPQPSAEDVDSLIWQTLRKKEASYTKNQKDHWMLDFASIQLSVNLHDWRHRKSCFKNGRTKCRYGIPLEPCICTDVTAVFTQPPPGIHATNPLNEETPHPKSQIKELHIDVKKRAPFTFITDSNSTIMSVINCNNCTKYVRDQQVSMYYGAYTTKHSTDCEKALAEAMLAIEKHENKVRKQQQQADNENERYQREREMEEDNMEEPQLPTPRRSDYSIGLGKLLSAIRASTNGDTIGDPLAAFALLGNNIFAMSHQTAPLPLTQAIGYLEKQNINATFTRFGEVKATIHDYVFLIQPKPRHRRHELLDLHQNASILQISSTKTKRLGQRRRT